MMQWLLSRSVTNFFSYLGECAIILYFASHLKKRTEGKFIGSGIVCLLALAILYFNPVGFLEPHDYSIRNLLLQCARMALHIAVVFGCILLNKDVLWQEALYLAGLFTVIYLASQNIRNALVMLVQPIGEITVYRQVLAYLFLAVEWFAVMLVCRFMDLSAIRTIHKSRWAFVSVALMLEVYIKWSLITVGAEQILFERWHDTVFFALMAAAGVLLILVLYEVNLQNQEQKAAAEAEQMRTAYEMQNTKRSIQANNDIRRLYHDMKNHLLAIQSISGGEEELNHYLSGLLRQFSDYEIQVSTGNATVDAVLSEKIQRASTEHIIFNTVLDLQDLAFVSSVDLVTIIGNAVDNAVEAVQRIPDEKKRIVYIKSSQFANMKVLRISNQFEGTIEQENGLPFTRKKDTSMHGIGLKSIQKVAERYGGSVSVEYDNDQKWFRLMVMIPLLSE